MCERETLLIVLCCVVSVSSEGVVVEVVSEPEG